MSNLVKFQELCAIKSSKRIHESDYCENGVPFIRGKEITDKTILDNKTQFECYISEELFKSIDARYGSPKQEDILITAVGTIGNAVILTNNTPFYFKDGNVIWLTDYSKKVYPAYLYYFLESNYFKKQIQFNLIGAVQKALTMDMLNKILVPLPSIESQQLIVKNLSLIDFKIENNNAIISELESLAKDIYDYWFVQFDFPNENGKPYKSSGGKMVWNEELKREIPEGWEVKSLFDGMDVVYGFPLSTEYFNDKSGIPVIRIRDILDNTSSAYTTENVPNYALSKNKDLLIGMDGNFHMNFCAQDDYIINQRITRIRNKSNISVLQIYFEIMPYIKAKEQNVARSTVGHLSDKDLKSLRIMDSHNSNIFIVFESILDKYCMLINENSELTSLRDFLLPLLMNGQVTVGGAEK